jgi:hypothetical protein
MLWRRLLLFVLMALGALQFDVASAAPAAQTALALGGDARATVIPVGQTRRGYRRRSIAPSYTYYDYPYYRSRGYYPTHIPGFLYDDPVIRADRARARLAQSCRARCSSHRGRHSRRAARRTVGACGCR